MKSKKRWPAKRLAAFAGVIAAGVAIAMTSSWALTSRLNNYAYDFLLDHMRPAPWTTDSIVVSIDEETLQTMGGQREYRAILADALTRINAGKPRTVAIDMILADRGDDQLDARLEKAMLATPNLVLSCEIVGNGWEDPIPRFRQTAVALGEVYSVRRKEDGVSRVVPLEQTQGKVRRWALALETFRVFRGARFIEEESNDNNLVVADSRIPAPREGADRPLWIRYRYEGIPSVSVASLRTNPALASKLTGKAVFVGVTAMSAARDRLVNPYGQDMPGVEINAQAFETLQQGRFLTPARNYAVIAVCFIIAMAAGTIFYLMSGWWSYILSAALLIAAHSVPVIFFLGGIIFPYSLAISTAWLSVVGAAAFQYFSTRRELRTSQSDKARYQEAIHFVTHEMRTPLTAIQGSSELMGRYNLTDDKRKQMAQMINMESKRLARMVQTFLDVERLSEGQMEMKREPFPSRLVIESCVDRVRPLAERKQIQLFVDSLSDDTLLGDRELLEYAVYNLLTNAVKYSPAETEVHVESVRDGDSLRVSVRDQGIGMNAKELRSIFKKFYRTKKAEASGEAGTGIGLSIVEQIVVHHSGRMEVSSEPGKGSTFTIILPAGVTATTK